MSKILQLCQYYLHSEGLQGFFFFQLHILRQEPRLQNMNAEMQNC